VNFWTLSRRAWFVNSHKGELVGVHVELSSNGLNGVHASREALEENEPDLKKVHAMREVAVRAEIKVAKHELVAAVNAPVRGGRDQLESNGSQTS
jgi:hypothetical protein